MFSQVSLPKATEIKAKINQWDLIKLTNFAQQREPKTKQKDTEWEKIISNDATDKGLSLEYINNLYNPTAKKTINQWKNGQKT